MKARRLAVTSAACPAVTVLPVSDSVWRLGLRVMEGLVHGGVESAGQTTGRVIERFAIGPLNTPWRGCFSLAVISSWL